MNTLVFKIFSLLSREAIFLAIFMKNMVDPLVVNTMYGFMQSMHALSLKMIYGYHFIFLSKYYI